jgi:hypothetical protein
MLVAYRALTQGLTTRFAYSWWAWLLLPLGLLAVEIVGRLPRLLYLATTNPKALGQYFAFLLSYLAKVWQHGH